MERSANYPTGEVLKPLYKMLAIVVACEFLIMVILYRLQWLGPWSVILDPLLLFLIVTPVLYCLVIPAMGATFLVSRSPESTLGAGEEALHLFRNLYEQTDDIHVIVEPHTGQLLDVNESLSKILGYNRAELLTMMVTDFDVKIPSKEAWSVLVEELRSKSSMILESELKRKDGTTVPVEVNVRYTVLKGNNYLVVVGRDISERKRAEKTLRAREQQLSLIYDSVVDVLYYLAVEPDDCFRFLSVNAAFLAATGLAEDQIVGKCIEEVIPEPFVALVKGNYKKAIEEKGIVRWEETSEYPNGIKIGEVSIAPIPNDDGICTHLVGSVHDITERKHTERKLLTQATVIEKVTEGICLVRQSNGEIVFTNPAFDEMFGYDPRQLIGKHVSVLNAPSERNPEETASEIIDAIRRIGGCVLVHRELDFLIV